MDEAGRQETRDIQDALAYAQKAYPIRNSTNQTRAHAQPVFESTAQE